MSKLRLLYLIAFAVVGLSAPIGAYTGYYAPSCGEATVWMPSGFQTRYVCF